MKIINIINIPNYPNYSIHGKEWGLLKVHVSDLLPDDEIEYNGEDTKDYVKCALSIITCIRSVREQVYITGECNVY